MYKRGLSSLSFLRLVVKCDIAERRTKMVINLNATELWTDNVRPYIQETVLMECRTDSVLTDKLNILVDHVDQDIKRGASFTGRLEQLNAVLNSDSYYDNALKRAKEVECEKVRELGRRIAMLYSVSRKERPEEVQTVKVESQKLPNRLTDVRDMYKPIEELK